MDLADSSSKFNPLKNGSDEKDLKMIGGWIDSLFGTRLVSEPKAAASTPVMSATPATPTPPSPAVATPAPTDGATRKAYRDSIASIESRGSGGYSAVGPVTRSGDRAYGRYQVMGANIPEWSRAALGKKLSIQEFMASSEAQDAIFDHRFGQYVKQFGNPQDAASAWLTGKPLVTGANLRDLNGTSGAAYAARFTSGLGGSTTTSSVVINGGVTVNTKATDATGIARDIGGAIRAQSFAAQANSGQN